MMDETETPISPESVAPPAPEEEAQIRSERNRSGIVIAIVGVVILALIITASVLLLQSDNATTGRVRDLFIILMAVESIVIGVALVVLIVQLATLINLLNNEIRPIIHSTNETVNTLKGTVTFLSDNLSEPVIRLNEYMAAVKKFVDLVSPRKR